MKNYTEALGLGLAHGLMVLSWNSSSFLLFWAMAFLASWVTYIVIKDHFEPKKLWVIFVAILPGYLLVEADDDVYRYLVEGKMILAGMNPYQVAPSSLMWNWDDIAKVNHSDWTAIYGPLYLEMMAGFMVLFGSVLSLKLVWLVFHGINAWLLMKLASKHAGLIYAFSPFVLFETIGQAHLEQLLVTGVLLMIYATKKNSSYLMTIGILMSCWIKWWLLPALPLVIRRAYLKALLLSVVLSAFIFWPFISNLEGMVTSLFDFKELWSCGYPYLWVSELVGLGAAKILVFLFLLSIGVSVLLFGGNLSEQIWQLFRWSLFFAPTLHPWYFIFPLAAALSSNKRTTFFVIGVLAMGLHHPEFSYRVEGLWESNWVYCLPLFIAMFFSEWRLKHHFFMQQGETVERFTVITPVLNEEKNLGELGRQICLMSDSIQEWIVVDAGSKDQSVQVAESYGAQVHSPDVLGRGQQICYALLHAKNEWVVVIHADTRLPLDFFKCLKCHIARVPNLDGGAFKMAYRDYEHMGPLHWVNDLKFRLFGVSFGDQSQFFHRERLKSRGNFPNLALMEDLELSLIWKGGHVAYISETKSLTSPRRWKKVGRLRNTLQILSLLCNYLLQRHWNPPVDVKKLYKRYYA